MRVHAGYISSFPPTSMPLHVEMTNRQIDHGLEPYGYSILEPFRYSPADTPGSGVGDFVAGAFTLPQNPVVYKGMGDFVSGRYAVPQNPIRDAGMSGCGCGGSCGGCGGGMGAIDLSFSGTGIASSVMAGSTIPNYWIYLAGGALLLIPLMGGKGRRR